MYAIRSYYVFDITKHYNANIALKESEMLIASMAESLPVGIFRTNEYGETIFVNKAWINLTGVDGTKITNWLDHVHPDDAALVKNDWELVQSQKRSSRIKYRFVRADGSVIWVVGEIKPIFNYANDFVGYIGSLTDISELKYTKGSLEKERALLQTIINEAPFCIYIKDKDCRKIMTNNVGLPNIQVSESDIVITSYSIHYTKLYDEAFAL